MLPIVFHLHYSHVTLTSWTPDPVVMLGVLLAGFAYLRLIGPWRARFMDAEPVERARVARFLGALVVLVIALLSPLEPLADDYLLTAHMVQHLLLTLAVPPLVL